MRKVNAILGPALIVLLLIHAISGVLQLYGFLPGGNTIRSVLSWLLAGCTAFHAVIGIVLTVQTLRACKRSGRAYFRGNERFWIARLSGFAMLFLILYHILIFTEPAGEVFRLQAFGWVQTAAHILLVLALGVHLITNIRPLFMGLGIENRTFLRDILIVLSVVLLVCAAAFIYYYLRWNVLWRYGT